MFAPCLQMLLLFKMRIVSPPAGCHGLLYEHEHKVQQEEAGPSSFHRPQTEVKTLNVTL